MKSCENFFETLSCYPSFLAWNNFWKNSFTREDVGTGLNSITHVHRYYEEWAKSNTEKHLPFQNLWENVMIRSTSEAICETVGSMMAHHGAKNHSLQPKNFNIEMYLRFNLPTLHHSDGLVNEVLAFDKKRLTKGEKKDC